MLLALPLLFLAFGFYFMWPEPDRPERERPKGAASVPEARDTAAPATTEVQKPVQAKTSPESGAGVLSIASDPPGALVFIDGERRGATPTRITGLPTEREFDLRLEAEGFYVWQQKMQIEKDAPVRSLQAGLRPSQACQNGEGWLYISTEPKGATVELNGKRFPGTTPMIIDKVCAGQNHELRLQAIGYRPWLSGQVEVSAGDVKNINVSLEK